MYAQRINPYPKISNVMTTIFTNLSEEAKKARYVSFRLPLPDGVFSTTFKKGKPGTYSLVEICSSSKSEGGHCDIFFQNKTGACVILGATNGRYGCLPLIIDTFLEQLTNPNIMKKAKISISPSTRAKPSQYLQELFKNFKPAKKINPEPMAVGVGTSW